MSKSQYGESPIPEGAFEMEFPKHRSIILRLAMWVRPWWGMFILTLLTALLSYGGAIAAAATGALLLRCAVEGMPLLQLRPYLIALGGLTLLAALMEWATSWVAHYMAYGILAVMRSRVYKALEPLAPAYTLARRSGDLISMVMADIELLEWFYAHTAIPILVACIVPAATLIVLGTLHWSLPLALLPFLILVAALPLYLRPRGDALAQRLQGRLGRVNAHMVDSIQGLREIVAFGRGRTRLGEVETESRSLTGLQIAQGKFIGRQFGAIQAAVAFGALVVLAVSVRLEAGGDMLSYQVPIAVVLAMGSFGPLLELTQKTRSFNRIFAAARRFFAVIDEPVLIQEKPGVKPLGPVEPSISFENVTFHYRPDEPPVLKNVSFTVRPGETLALVGHSGSGKTTVARLLMRFWDPQRGRITLGGHDLRDFPLEDLRSRIAIVQQDNYLFNTTIRENIRLGKPDATDEEVEEAARLACAHEFIASLPEGYETVVGERGAKLSGGQRQRVAIARALLKDAPILILDEATSNLDSENERAIREGIRQLMKGRTTLVIAHRLSTIVTADRVVVLDDGEVVERGTHEELLAREGAYARMIAAQRDVIA